MGTLIWSKCEIHGTRCQKETTGTCQIFPCKKSRGATDCIHGKCFCAGDTCSLDGETCVGADGTGFGLMEDEAGEDDGKFVALCGFATLTGLITTVGITLKMARRRAAGTDIREPFL